MASWNLPIQINRLVQEITDIGEYVGYFWTLIPNDTGIVVSGSTPLFSATSPNTNNTSYAYSNIKRNEPWALSCVVEADTFMSLGISTDLTANFSNPSAPSMKMMNYGLAFDTQGANAIYFVVDGVYSGTAQTCNSGSTVLISYDGTTLKYFVNNVQIFSSITATIDPINLVVASVYGGSVSSISFTGSGGSSGGSQNLQETLQNGNDANDLDIINVGNLSLNKYLTIGNGITGTSQIHLCWDSGNTTTGKNIQIIATGNNSESQLLIQSYDNNILKYTIAEFRDDGIVLNRNVETPSGIYSGGNIELVKDSSLYFDSSNNSYYEMVGKSSNVEFTMNYIDTDKNVTQVLNINNEGIFGNLPQTSYTFGNDSANFSPPNILTTGIDKTGITSSKYNGQILDSYFNPPILFLNSQYPATTPKTIPYNSPISILSFNVAEFGTGASYCNLVTGVLSQLQIQNFQVATGTNNTALYLQMWLSDTLNGDFSPNNPLEVSYTSPNIGFGGQPAGFKASKVIMSHINQYNAFSSVVYLNVKVNGAADPANTFILNGMSFTSQLQLQPASMFSTAITTL